MLAIMGAAVGRAPDAVRSVLYRKEPVGRPWSEPSQLVVRGPSPWSVGERETFAALESRLDHRLVRTSARSAVAEAELGEGTARPVLDDYRAAPSSEPLRATLGRVETFTPYRARLGAAAVGAAFYVALRFDAYDRLARHARGELPGARHDAKAGAFLLKAGSP